MNIIPGKRKKSLPGRAAGWTDNILFILFAAMVIAVTANMTSRLLFNRPIIQSDEISRYCFIWLCFIGAVSALGYGEHIGVDLVVKRLPEKLQKGVLVLTHLMMSALSAVCSWYGWIIAGKSLGQMSSVTPIPYGYVVLIMPISFLAMSVIFLKNVARILRGGR